MMQYTPAAVQQALDIMAKLAAKTPLERAQLRFLAAKRAFNLATEAVMRREPGSSSRADDAIAEFNAARAELDAVQEREAAGQ